MAMAKRAMNLTEEPNTVTWPETHYVFIEKIGPFQDNAPQAWQNLHQIIPGISEHNKITGYSSLSRSAQRSIAPVFRLLRNLKIYLRT